MKSFSEFIFSEAPLPPPSPSGSMPSSPASLPPMPPPSMPPMGGGPSPLPGGGGPSTPQEQPMPVKKVSVGDVWEQIKEAVADMEKYKQLTLTYFKTKDKLKNKKENSSLD